MIQIKTLDKSKAWHVGLYYYMQNDECYEGPLPKTDPEILEMLFDLSDLLVVTRIK